jgi:hypothetical protein
LQFVGIIAALALFGALFAGPASAKRMSAKQKAHVRAELRKQVKKNPKVVSKKSFLKKASLVNFKLPVTIRLRGSNAATNPNQATIDLGPSLGQREINLGGKLAAEIQFADSFDGGALGNVKLAILPSTTKALTSTSIPLLWNNQVSNPATRWDANLLGLPSSLAGCGNFTGAGALPLGSALGPGPAPVGGIPQPGGLPGVPYYDLITPGPAPPTPSGFLPVKPGVDSITALTASKIPGSNINLGGNPNPFPQSAAMTPGGFAQPPSVQDTVLRTSALNLTIASPGTEVTQTDGSLNGPEGSQNTVIGQSGGEANLFGNIPGKGYGIDVTVSLGTRINSIFRIVDQDSFGSPLFTGNKYPAGIFGCRQIYSGAVQNYIPGVRLQGNLKISPGITSDGFLRIAKATIASPPTQKARIALAACLAPYGSFATPINSSDTNPVRIPTVASGPGLVADNDSNLPANPATSRATPESVDCDAPPTKVVEESALDPAVVSQQLPAGAGYTTAADGSRVSVSGDLNVNNVEVDVLIGDH